MSAQLSIRNLSKRFKTGEGVQGIDFDVNKGELVTLLGPSGCGKTTVLRSIGGFLTPDSGDILIEGRSVIKLPPEKRPTSMVFQSYNLWTHMSVFDNLSFGLKIRKVSKADIRERVADVLKLVQLPGAEKKFPSELSGGQQQRVALARSLLLQPSVLLLDEPFSALDAKLRYEMREELRDIQRRIGLTMVFVTHDQEEALSLSDRIVVMNGGHIDQIAPPEQLYEEPETLFVAQFIGKMNFMEGAVDEDKIRIGAQEFPNAKRLAGEVILASRPEDVSLVPETGQGGGLPGKVKQIMALGHYADVSVELAGGGTVRSFQSKDAVKAMHVGQDVRVSFSRVIPFSENHQT